MKDVQHVWLLPCFSHVHVGLTRRSARVLFLISTSFWNRLSSSKILSSQSYFSCMRWSNTPCACSLSNLSLKNSSLRGRSFTCELRAYRRKILVSKKCQEVSKTIASTISTLKKLLPVWAVIRSWKQHYGACPRTLVRYSCHSGAQHPIRRLRKICSPSQVFINLVQFV